MAGHVARIGAIMNAHNPEERSSRPLRGGSRKSLTKYFERKRCLLEELRTLLWVLNNSTVKYCGTETGGWSLKVTL
jgi:hypothetical protein